MASSFPSSLDTFTNPSSTDALDSVSVPHATQHSDLNDAVEALQAKVGADSSGVTSSHDYKIAQLEAGATGGKILQVVSTSKVDAFTTTAGAFTDVTGLSATITPTSATSTILVTAAVSMGSAAGYSGYLNLVRDSTDIAQSTGGSAQNMTKLMVPASAASVFNPTVVFEDSPATTSATTYKIQIKSSTGGQVVSVNRRADTANFGSTSSITVMEISA